MAARSGIIEFRYLARYKMQNEEENEGVTVPVGNGESRSFAGPRKRGRSWWRDAGYLFPVCRETLPRLCLLSAAFGCVKSLVNHDVN